jgi:hypothetical protein
MASKSKKHTLLAGPVSSPSASAPASAPTVKPFLPPVSLESLAGLGRENLAAMTKANLALTEGMQAVSQEIFGLAQLSIARAAKTASALLAARTLDELVEVSSAHTRANFETLAERTAKLGEMGVSIATETLAPFVARAASA